MTERDSTQPNQASPEPRSPSPEPRSPSADPAVADRAPPAVDAVDPRPDAPADKKERVLHTRVPAVLEQELKRLADNIRVPVSNLVRAILEDAVAVADRAGRGVEEELHKAATNLTSRREAILAKKDRVVTQKALEGVLGFQPLVLAGEAVCARCLSPLHPGDDAHLGVTADAAAPRVVVCDPCLPRRRKDSSHEPKEIDR